MTQNRVFIGVSALFLCDVIGACKRDDDSQAAAKEQAMRVAANEAAAKPGEAAFEKAVAEENWTLAKAHADVLMASYPESAASQRVRIRYEEVKNKAKAAKDLVRLQGLWSYNTEKVQGGQQLSASIFSKKPVAAGEGKKSQVRLIFRDHASWGRSSYLVMQSGDFDCYGGCKIKIIPDSGAAKSFAASRPKTDEAIAMFIEDEKALWRLVTAAKSVSIEFPVKNADKQTALFEIGGLDADKLPNW